MNFSWWFYRQAALFLILLVPLPSFCWSNFSQKTHQLLRLLIIRVKHLQVKRGHWLPLYLCIVCSPDHVVFFHCSFCCKIAEEIRHILDNYDKAIPAILEIPSKEHPYDPSKDSILRRAKVSSWRIFSSILERIFVSYYLLMCILCQKL